MKKPSWIAPLLTLVLMVGMGAEVLRRPVRAEAEPYHMRVFEASASALMPEKIGKWVGVDRETSQDAIDLLKPNVLYNRLYTHESLPYQVGVLIVHCKDARNLNGHYPPVCYPNMGMAEDLEDRLSKTWEVGGESIAGTEYVFGGGSMVVDNFLMIPGQIVPDMSAVTKAAYNVLKRHFGAAQVQVVFSSSLSMPAPEKREEIFKMMIEAHLSIIQSIIGDRK